MLECRYCRRPFPTTFAQTQHLRQRPFSHRAYKCELVALAMHTPIWQVDDPEEMPSDMEGHEMDTVDKADDLMEDRRVNEAGNRQGDEFGRMSLFEAYLTTVAGKSCSDPIPTPVEW
jgi:hypothetical protein